MSVLQWDETDPSRAQPRRGASKRKAGADRKTGAVFERATTDWRSAQNAFQPRMRTRIKICGLSSAEHIDAAVEAGADAIGFVFYPPSVRALTPARAARLAERVPAFVSTVALFVDASAEAVRAVLEEVRVDVLQFHGSSAYETAAWCTQFGRPYIKATPVTGPIDVLEFARSYMNAAALLLDTPSSGHGGSGRRFDWRLIRQPDPHARPPRDASGLDSSAAPVPRLVLSGGLTALNVAEAIASVRPYAVDVSSGVEVTRGTKSSELIHAFCRAVREADQQLG
ncbi:MAG: phosphoribosylanthranilate isomerase [Casimicrobiaceae bacterium]